MYFLRYKIYSIFGSNGRKGCPIIIFILAIFKNSFEIFLNMNQRHLIVKYLENIKKIQQNQPGKNHNPQQIELL
jgi:hypothetical protein